MSRRPFSPKVVAANDLLDGDAVWLSADDTWTRQMSEAELIEDEAIAEDRLIFALGQSDVVVGAYLVDAEATEHGPAPTHFREMFRTRGPSNYAHGKQDTAASAPSQNS